MPVYHPMCMECEHYNYRGEAFTCEAFPGGIPEEIITGEFEHNKPWPNEENPQDNGIRFEPVEGE